MRYVAAKAFAVSLILVCCTLNLATAQSSRASQWLAKLPDRFAIADVNKDGRLEKDEARVGMPAIYKKFEQIDVKGRGWISLEDIYQAFAAYGLRP